MVINDALVGYLEDLSRLQLDEKEKDLVSRNLNQILNYMDKLNELDTSGKPEISHPFEETNIFREDQVRPSFEREQILYNAPAQKDGCFKVAKTVVL